jgi:hypothetical protein
MPRLYMITVPGLEVKSDWRIVHDRLLDDFPLVDDVLPTTTPETLLIVYRGRAHVDEWLDALAEGVLATRPEPGPHPTSPRPREHHHDRRDSSTHPPRIHPDRRAPASRSQRLPSAGQALGQSLTEFKGSLMGERIGGETLSVSHGSGTSSANYDDRPAPSDA